MIQEAYVSFETAKLLKEKGFDEKCLHYYEDNRHRDEGIKFSDWCNIEYSNSEIGRRFTCPTQQMAMRWLREKHNIHISITFGWVSGYNAQVDWAEESEKGNDKLACCVWRTDLNTTYEAAVEAAIKYCLENLMGYES